MVCNKSNTTTGVMKRSTSAIEGPPGSDVTPSSMTSPRSSLRLPFNHYALIHLDSEGKFEVDESSSIRKENSGVFSSETRWKFLEILGVRNEYQPFARRMYPEVSSRRVKRRRGNAPSISSSDDDRAEPGSDRENLLPARSGKVQRKYSVVAEAFIKFIEPRKQARYPYNGCKPPPGSLPGSRADPEKTKPEWWPRGVIHMEPDHLLKDSLDRIQLLLHILRNLGKYGATAAKLEEVAGDTKRKLKHPSHVKIIYEILRVRKMEECFERGEVNADMVVHVYNCGFSHKGDGDEDEESAKAPTTLKAPERVEDDLLTPTSSVEQVSAPLTTPIEIVNRSMPGHFSILETLNFEGCDGHAFYARPPHHADLRFSQSILSTPATTEMMSLHRVSVSDYPSQNPFPTSTSDQQRTTADRYDAWSSPIFRQNISSPFDHSAPPSGRNLLPPSIFDHIPMASPATGPVGTAAPHRVARSPARTTSLVPGVD
ncbi:hypothetical protein N7539_008818 [Penicillium diatomitis]|uniref:Subtelomeric hrmA-associated cluster protein AFUB-079030/YDR124W-like helical bundle domain-containing protein n=1 Tax=Penicillium diatomitis TaxID=2819901 RepID=A0A9X0BLN0_9EURO|nr:uncharacterized protein N7539_008818 [Penicillium diatomitis]KAJ5471875.1 hypothetical protein N7539_008818 [Penicillium diatomitis]